MVDVRTGMIHMGKTDTILHVVRVLRGYRRNESISIDPSGTKAEKVVTGHHNTLEVRP